MATTAPVHADMDESQAHDAELQRQKRRAEELLFSEPSRAGFAKALFRGEFRGGVLFPYPELPPGERATVDAAVEAVRQFAETSIDAEAIDRDADIPRS